MRCMFVAALHKHRTEIAQPSKTLNPTPERLHLNFLMTSRKLGRARDEQAFLEPWAKLQCVLLLHPKGTEGTSPPHYSWCRIHPLAITH